VNACRFGWGIVHPFLDCLTLKQKAIPLSPNMTELKIFYSWQSDKHIPPALNRTFIQNSLEKAAATVKRNSEYSIDPMIDRDTLGTPGAPNIVDEILRKISQSDVFVCDVTIVNTKSKFRLSPNPNVMLELGYALRSLGWDRIVMVINEHFGRANQLPFDLPWRRAITYSLGPNEERDQARQTLIGKLTFNLSEIIKASAPVVEKIDKDERLEPSKAELLSRQTVFAKERALWLNSEAGVRDAQEEALDLYEEIKELFERDGEHHQTMGNELRYYPEANPRRISLVHRGMMAFNLQWVARYVNTLEDSELVVEVKVFGDRSDRNGLQTYQPDIDSNGKVVWGTENEKPHQYTTKEMGVRIYEQFLEEIRIVSQPR
jgi:hypothetical protein